MGGKNETGKDKSVFEQERRLEGRVEEEWREEEPSFDGSCQF